MLDYTRYTADQNDIKNIYNFYLFRILCCIYWEAVWQSGTLKIFSYITSMLMFSLQVSYSANKN